MMMRPTFRLFGFLGLSIFAGLIEFGAGQATGGEALGPSSRRTGLSITEIMYHPPPRPDLKNLEFLELYNSEPTSVDLSGYRISGDVDFEFPNGTLLPAGGFLVVAKVPEDVAGAYGTDPVTGGYASELPNNQGVIRLRHPAGGILLEITYSDDPPWSVAADGAGHSLVLAHPSLGEGDPQAWTPSRRFGGSPGTDESTAVDPLDTVVINEFLAHTDDPDLDFVELFNSALTPADVSGVHLSDTAGTNRFTLPANTWIPAQGFLAVDQLDLGFSLTSSGERIFLVNSEQTRVLDALAFEGQALGTAAGRYPDGAPGFQELTASSPGSANDRPLTREIVINEIMFHPISENGDDEYVELFNRGAKTADLSGWRFTEGIDFTFPTNTTLAPDAYLVIARNATNLLVRYPQLSPQNTVGDFGGALSDAGERLALARPEDSITLNPDQTLTTNFYYVVVDELTYGDSGQWGRWADGGGSSLELVDPHSDNRYASNWADSDETAKSGWTLIEAHGVLDHGRNTPDALQVLAQGTGEYLVDEVEVIPDGGVNRIVNPSLEQGTTGWLFQGSHDTSTVETGGYGGGQALHLRAITRGDVGPNRVRASLTSNLSVGETATIQARVRWLCGHPELLLRLYGNYLEAFKTLDLPSNLGTPGTPNSRVLSNAGPTVTDVEHRPVLPQANQDVVVTARIGDPDTLGIVELHYRVDPAVTPNSVPMLDDGIGGDAREADGVYSATIPRQAARSLVAFYITASDDGTPVAETRFPIDGPTREALIRFSETQRRGQLSTYRLWMTQATYDRWRTRNKMDNTPLDVTFVYNGDRVVYNARALYAGSPHISPGYTTPTGRLCGYVLIFPKDDLFLGAREVVLDWPDRDASKVQEHAVYWMAGELGLATLQRRFIHLHVNGVTEIDRGGVYEDAQQVNTDYIESWYPGRDQRGDLFKIEQWFEFDANVSRTALVPPTLQPYTTTDGELKRAPYRWMWLKRAVQDSANNYENIFDLVEAANRLDTDTYTRAIEQLADVEQWMRVFALEHIIGNFDSYGHQIGKNMYAYKPPAGPWQMHMWDIDWLMNASVNRVTPTSPLFESEDPTVGRMYNHPPFRRAYYRAVKDTVDGPLRPEKVNSYLDAKNAALIANGISASSTLAGKEWLAERRAFLQQELAAVDAPFAITSQNGLDFEVSNSNRLELEGTAPVEVHTLQINDRSYPVTWTSINTWRVEIPLTAGANALNLQAVDRFGLPLPGLADTVTVTYSGSVESPEDYLVINEIMYRAAASDADYVELYNSSPSHTFDLSGYRLSGAGYFFPAGTIIRPQEHLVVAENSWTFLDAYGAGIRMQGDFLGRLTPDTRTLSLVHAGVSPDQDLLLDTVTFAATPPWPVEADGWGPSLQLIDPARDNDRVGNWAVINEVPPEDPPFVSDTLLPITASWRYHQSGSDLGTTWVAESYDDSSWSSGNALLYVEGSALPAQKSTPLQLGQSTYYFRTHFPFTGDPTTIALSLSPVIDDGAVIHLNGQEIFRLGMDTGAIDHDTFANRVVGDAAFEGPFVVAAEHLRVGDNMLAVEVHQTNPTSSDIVMGLQINTAPIPVDGDGDPRFTPGARNSVIASLPALPDLRLNEIQPDNQTGPTDAQGDHDPWLEILNTGTAALDLDGLYLSDDYAALAQWTFPVGTRLDAGAYLIVWLDGEPGETIGNELHTNFRIAPDTGSVALSQTEGESVRIIDYLNYATVPADAAFGLSPDGWPGGAQILPPTPGLTNLPDPRVIRVFINEWMADNTRTLADPADGDFEDWFELYNAGDEPADLAGATLTDDLSNPFKYLIPAGTVIPPHEFLLVWADEEGGQNGPSSGALHANFKLARTGETIALYAADGTQLDAVTFGAQSPDTSQGLAIDGVPGTDAFLSLPTPGGPNGIVPPPDFAILEFNVTDDQVQLRWKSIPGATYQVQVKDNLRDLEWQLADLATATADTTQLTLPPSPTRQRYYRILHLE